MLYHLYKQLKNIKELKDIVNNKALIMAKIEKPSAVKNLSEILVQVDGIMIARGDLGVELPPELVPAIQKNIIQKCREAGKASGSCNTNARKYDK